MDFFNFLKINTKYLKDLIAANCSDNWHTHLQSVKKLLAFFEEYIQEYFVGKTNSGSFNAIPSDMKLEQAI